MTKDVSRPDRKLVVGEPPAVSPDSSLRFSKHYCETCQVPLVWITAQQGAVCVVCLKRADDACTCEAPVPSPAPAVSPPGWQPIETAPKDGTSVDLWAGGRQTDCHWGRMDWEITHLGWPGTSVGWVQWSDRDSAHGRVEDATHWMPLPSPPVADPVPQEKEVGIPAVESVHGMKECPSCRATIQAMATWCGCGWMMFPRPK